MNCLRSRRPHDTAHLIRSMMFKVIHTHIQNSKHTSIYKIKWDLNIFMLQACARDTSYNKCHVSVKLITQRSRRPHDTAAHQQLTWRWLPVCHESVFPGVSHDDCLQVSWSNIRCQLTLLLPSSLIRFLICLLLFFLCDLYKLCNLGYEIMFIIIIIYICIYIT